MALSDSADPDMIINYQLRICLSHISIVIHIRRHFKLVCYITYYYNSVVKK